LQDSGFIIKDDTPISAETINSLDKKFTKNKWNLLAVIFIFIGIVALLNQLISEDVYNIIRSAIRNCIIPAFLIVSGIYILLKGNKKKL